MKKIVLASLAATVLASPALAADFTGPRVEVHGGWDHLGAKYTYTDTAFPADNFKLKESKEGFVYGVGVGYDFPLGETLIAGVLANFDLSTTKKCSEVYGGDALCFKAKRDIEVGARLGQTYDKVLIYFAASYVNGRGRFSYTDPAAPADNFSISENRDGIRLGVGTEYAFTSNLYGKLEYRYSDYKNSKAAIGTESESFGFDRHQLLGGLGVRF